MGPTLSDLKNRPDAIAHQEDAPDVLTVKEAAALAEMTDEELLASDAAQGEFVLRDSSDGEVEEELLFDTNDIASDEDILKAEEELDKKNTDGESHV